MSVSVVEAEVVPVAQPVAQTVAQPLAPYQPASASALDRLQTFTSWALAETAYHARRLGASTLAGIAAVVLAATLFIANNLPQGAAVLALKSQLVRLAPLSKGATVSLPGSSAMLASLPPRGEAPSVVAKILEEAKASGEIGRAHV